uniref:uncharacterized protein LOC120340234 isoform X2 n=1 Tax=Styela clava TaxID=7725 RepID=UPI0019395967|nr:uncharacterized protein LOC120340234 isoform X2 [Styela clava]
MQVDDSDNNTQNNEEDMDTLLIGDSQMAHMEKKLKNKKIVKRSYAGGTFQRLTLEIEKEQRKYENIVIYAGTNDIIRTDKEIEEDIRTMITKAREFSENVYVCGIVPFHGRRSGKYGCDRINKQLEAETIEQGSENSDLQC